MTNKVTASRYLFSSITRSEIMAATQIVVATAALVILGSSYSMTWFSLSLSFGGLLLGVFLAAMFTVSLEFSSKRREIAILRALGARRANMLAAFLRRTSLFAVTACVIGALIGYSVAVMTPECSLLSIGVVMFAMAASFISSFSGGAIGAKGILDVRVAEVLRQ